MKILNIAVWGVGQHAINRIIPAILSTKRLVLVGVSSRNKDILNSCIEKFDCFGWKDPKEMLNFDGLDVIFIATPIGLHAEQAKLALEAGKHVWCEKPLTCKFKDTASLVSIAKKEKLMLTEGFMFLHHPQFHYIKSFVKDNQKSGIKSIVCRLGMPFLERPSFRNDLKLCGGALWDIGSYTIAAVLSLFPHQDVEVLFSKISKAPGSNVDSEGKVILKFSEGASAYLEWGFGTAYKNDIDIWANDNSIFTDKIFSKPLDYQPEFNMRDKTGKMRIIKGKKSEQFQDMFASYCDLYNFPKKINIEYINIINRSRLMDQIINFSKENQTF